MLASWLYFLFLVAKEVSHRRELKIILFPCRCFLGSRGRRAWLVWAWRYVLSEHWRLLFTLVCSWEGRKAMGCFWSSPSEDSGRPPVWFWRSLWHLWEPCFIILPHFQFSGALLLITSSVCESKQYFNTYYKYFI